MTKRQLRRQRWRQRGQQAEPPKTLLSVLLSVDLSAMMAAVDRIVQMTLPAAEALRQVGIAASSPFIRSAVARYAALEEDALRLSIRTPLGPEQARSLIREHGLEFAERVGELVSRGWSVERAVEVVSGRDAQGYRLVSQYMDLPSPPRFDTGALQATPRLYPRKTNYYLRPPNTHGTPSSFGEVLSDAAVAKHQPVLTPCATCRNHDDNPYLSCAFHPLERPGHECSDWEDNGTESAAMARGRAELRAREAYGEAIVRRREAIDAASRRPEQHAYISAAGQVMWTGEMAERQETALEARLRFEQDRWNRDLASSYTEAGSRAVTNETTEEIWQWVQLPDGGQQRVLLSRTTTRHYADGRHEIVTQEAERSPRIEARTFINGIEQVVCMGDDLEPSQVQLPRQHWDSQRDWRSYGWPL